MSPETISGWAFGAAPHPNGPRGRSVWVHFFEGVTYLGSTPSNRVGRGDVARIFGIANAEVGFSWAPPALLAGVHTIRAFVNDSVFASQARLLGGQTTLVVPAANFVGPSPFGVLESASPGHVTGWACDPDG